MTRAMSPTVFRNRSRKAYDITYETRQDDARTALLCHARLDGTPTPAADASPSTLQKIASVRNWAHEVARSLDEEDRYDEDDDATLAGGHLSQRATPTPLLSSPFTLRTATPQTAFSPPAAHALDEITRAKLWAEHEYLREQLRIARIRSEARDAYAANAQAELARARLCPERLSQEAGCREKDVRLPGPEETRLQEAEQAWRAANPDAAMFTVALGSYKSKHEFQVLAGALGLDGTGTVKALTARIRQHMQAHPELADNPRFVALFHGNRGWRTVAREILDGKRPNPFVRSSPEVR